MTHGPSDEARRRTDRSHRTRRRYLAGIATAGSILVTGCLGGDDGGGDGGDGDGGDGDGGSTAESSTGSTASASTGSGDGSASSGSGTGGQSSSDCLSEFTFVPQQYSSRGDAEYVGQCEIPESARIQGGGNSSLEASVTAIVEYPNREYTSISVQGDLYENTGNRTPTVDSVLQAHREAADQVDWVEVTGRYDLAVDGARVIASSEDPVPAATAVVFSHPAGVLLSTMSADSSGCQAAAERFYVHVVESLQPV